MSNKVGGGATIATLPGDDLDAVVQARRMALAREALRLHRLGASLRTIGRTLGVSYETARALIREARQAGTQEAEQ